jgi:hypothetical protein
MVAAARIHDCPLLTVDDKILKYAATLREQIMDERFEAQRQTSHCLSIDKATNMAPSYSEA